MRNDEPQKISTPEQWAQQMKFADATLDPIIRLPPGKSDLQTFQAITQTMADQIKDNDVRSRSFTAMIFAAAIMRLRKQSGWSN